jgi:hypothetical protein
MIGRGIFSGNSIAERKTAVSMALQQADPEYAVMQVANIPDPGFLLDCVCQCHPEQPLATPAKGD